MNTTENNKLIAEFMGARFISDGMNAPDSKDIFVPFHGSCRIDTIELGKGKILKYHSSWDWLMPIVEKIETMSLTENRNHLPEFFIMYDQREYFKGWYWSISITKLFRKECLGRENTKIGTFYAAVVEFIKWYNEQNPKP